MLARRPTAAAALAACLAWGLAAPAAHADTLIDFETLTDGQVIGSVYQSTLGVVFSVPATVSISIDYDEGSGDFTGARAAMYFPTGDGVLMSVAEGFTSYINFAYSTGSVAGQALVYASADGSGTPIQAIPLFAQGTCASYTLCRWQDTGVSFTGTAYSVRFTGPADRMLIDDVAFGPSPVPEPSTWALMMAGGLALVSARARRRKTAA